MDPERLVVTDRLLVSIETAEPEEPFVGLVTESDDFRGDTELLFDSEWCERGVEEGDLCGQQVGGAAEDDVVDGHGGGGGGWYYWGEFAL